MSEMLYLDITATLPPLVNKNMPLLLLQYIVTSAQQLNAESLRYSHAPDSPEQQELRRTSRNDLIQQMYESISISSLDYIVKVSYSLKVLTVSENAHLFTEWHCSYLSESKRA